MRSEFIVKCERFHDIQIVDNGFIPVAGFLTALQSLMSFGICSEAHLDLSHIYEVTNHKGHLEVKCDSELPDDVRKLIKAAWYYLEGGCDVDFVIVEKV